MQKVVIGVVIFSLGLLSLVAFNRQQPRSSSMSPVSSKPSSTASNTSAKSLSTIPISFAAATVKDKSGNYPSIEYINSTARDSDYVVFFENSLLQDRQNHLNAIKQVKKGKIYQNFPSLKVAQQELPFLAGAIAGIMCDLELWDKSYNESQDIEFSSREMAQLAKKYNLEYIAHLGVKLALQTDKYPESIEKMSKYADAYSASYYPCLEQKTLSECVDLMRQTHDRARRDNPSIKFIPAISLEKNITPEDQRLFLEACLPFADAVGIFYLPNRSDSVSKFRDLLALLRS